MNKKASSSGDAHYVDLNSVADKIGSQKKYKKLVGCIENYHAASSVLMELRNAREYLDIGIDLMRACTPQPFTAAGTQDRNAAAIAGSVVSRAMLTYTRSLHTSSRVRNRTPIKDRLPNELKKAHQRIVDIRDHAVGHHGTASWAVRKPWIDERTVLKFDDQFQSLRMVVTTTNYMATQVQDLDDLINAAIPIANRLLDERNKEFFEELENHPDDQFLGRIIAESPFNAYVFYDGQQAADAFYSETEGKLPTLYEPDPNALDIAVRDAWERPDLKGKS
ncbi:hypothetical protein U1707_14245 [Sphingomonas sp. PB2P12]|uniref:hypothetical protein n=1 Tax=Sphingomonas sandaracina TaxID=3096157 RepID=UPI002FC68B3B